jgi:hypothetical protein
MLGITVVLASAGLDWGITGKYEPLPVKWRKLSGYAVQPIEDQVAYRGNESSGDGSGDREDDDDEDAYDDEDDD